MHSISNSLLLKYPKLGSSAIMVFHSIDVSNKMEFFHCKTMKNVVFFAFAFTSYPVRRNYDPPPLNCNVNESYNKKLFRKRLEWIIQKNVFDDQTFTYHRQQCIQLVILCCWSIQSSAHLSLWCMCSSRIRCIYCVINVFPCMWLNHTIIPIDRCSNETNYFHSKATKKSVSICCCNTSS